MADIASGSECSKAMDIEAQAVQLSSTGYTISIEFECEIGTQTTSPLYAYGTESENMVNAAILRTDHGDSNSITISSYNGYTLTWFWKQHGFSDADICNGEYHTVTARRSFTSDNERVIIFDGGVRATDAMQENLAISITNFCAGYTNVAVEYPKYTPFFCQMEFVDAQFNQHSVDEFCPPQMHSAPLEGHPVDVAQDGLYSTYSNSFQGTFTVAPTTMIYGGDLLSQRYIEFLELYRHPEIKSAAFCAWGEMVGGALRGVPTNENYVQVSRDGTTWKTVMQLQSTFCNFLFFPTDPTKINSPTDILNHQCTTTTDDVASYANCVEGDMTLRGGAIYQPGDLRVRIPKEYQPFRFFRLKLGTDDYARSRIMAFGEFIAVPETMTPFPGRLRNLRIWYEQLPDDCLDQEHIINLDRPGGFVPATLSDSALAEHPYYGRRAQSVTDTTDMGVVVKCDVGIESDRGRAVTVKIHQRDYEASDPGLCVKDCEKQPVCNYFDWIQTSQKEGRCILYSASNHTVERPQGPYDLDAVWVQSDAQTFTVPDLVGTVTNFDANSDAKSALHNADFDAGSQFQIHLAYSCTSGYALTHNPRFFSFGTALASPWHLIATPTVLELQSGAYLIQWDYVAEGVAICDDAFHDIVVRLKDRIITLYFDHAQVHTHPVPNWAGSSDNFLIGGELGTLSTVFAATFKSVRVYQEIPWHTVAPISRWTSGHCSPQRHPTDLVRPGVLEIWVSRSLARASCDTRTRTCCFSRIQPHFTLVCCRVHLQSLARAPP